MLRDIKIQEKKAIMSYVVLEIMWLNHMLKFKFKQIKTYIQILNWLVNEFEKMKHSYDNINTKLRLLF